MLTTLALIVLGLLAVGLIRHIRKPVGQQQNNKSAVDPADRAKLLLFLLLSAETRRGQVEAAKLVRKEYMRRQQAATVYDMQVLGALDVLLGKLIVQSPHTGPKLAMFIRTGEIEAAA